MEPVRDEAKQALEDEFEAMVLESAVDAEINEANVASRPDAPPVMGRIYKITSPDGKCYIGQTVLTVEQRWRQHISQDRPERGCTQLGAAMLRWGYENFKVEQLAEAPVGSQLDELECKYIAECRSIYPDGYNSTAGKGSVKVVHNDLVPHIVALEHGYRAVYRRPGLDQVMAFTDSNHTMEENLVMAQMAAADMKTGTLQPREEYLKTFGKNRKLPTYISPEKNGYRFRYQKDGKKKGRGFVDTRFTLEENLAMATAARADFLNTGSVRPTVEYEAPIIAARGGRVVLPRGICEKDTGYVVSTQINKKRHTRAYTSAEFTKAENLSMARATLEDFKRGVDIPREVYENAVIAARVRTVPRRNAADTDEKADVKADEEAKDKN